MKKYVLVVISLLFLFLGTAIGANYPLEIVRPEASGTIGSRDRIHKAYPGLTYTIRVAVYGGTYPFTYALNNEPSGMTIDTDTGVITWLNPQSNSGTITVTVTDAESSDDSASWVITVGTSGFYFVEASAGSGGDGTIGDPWDDWNDFYFGKTDSTYDGAMIYFKDGTYDYPSQYPDDTAGSSNRLWIGSGNPRIFLAYPGETAVYFDGERSGERIHLFSLQSNIYFSGINFVRGYGFNIEQNAGNYFCVQDCTFDDISGSGSSSNQAAISFRVDAPNDGNEPPVSDSGFTLYPVIQNCTFTNILINECGIKTYGIRYGVISDSSFENIGGDGIDLKSTTDKTMIRHNTFTDIDNDGVILRAQYYSHNTDISFNYFDDTSMQVGGYEGTAGPGLTYFYRNTLVGTLFFRFIDSGDGPVYISNNVIINSDPADHIRDEIGEHETITANMSVLSDNLMGESSDNIVDSNGELLGTYREQYLGSRGWELGEPEDIISITLGGSETVIMGGSQTLTIQ